MAIAEVEGANIKKENQEVKKVHQEKIRKRILTNLLVTLSRMATGVLLNIHT